MKSRAHIQTHPLHPILVPFPIAFLTGTFFFDTLGFFTGAAILWQVGYYLEIAGMVTALIAAIPGLIDYKSTVPPRSSASKRAATHGLLNSAALLVFLAAFLLRERVQGDIWVVVIEAAGTGLLITAGWMGGTLVHRNHIGVYNRYANGGKWKEARTEISEGLIEAGEMDELKEDQMKLLLAGDRRIVLGRTEKGYVAFDDRCSHKGGSLAAGTLMCGKVQCPWHGSQFDCRSGEVKAGPAKEGIRCYPVIERHGKLFIRI
ncbi:DUF2231 domain-containing protein [Arcticibacter sp. MXS-1]|uniref:DUF2231 domain-containing protein n=1 Tax=Arcticibacter sp. MXS-1 TaxID=3341726 RepID=UPI0035A90BB9